MVSTADNCGVGIASVEHVALVYSMASAAEFRFAVNRLWNRVLWPVGSTRH
jgi:hypothetical protein